MLITVRSRIAPHARFIAVVTGGVLGAAVRTAVADWMAWTGDGWPVATLTVNIAGAALLAFFLARRAAIDAARWSLEFWAVGLLGSLTTFSALSLEVVLLADVGRYGVAATYALLSPVLGLLAAWVGRTLGRQRW